MDKDIPGTSTFNKPEDDIRDFDKSDEKSMYEVENTDDQLTGFRDVNDSNANKHDGIGAWGKGERPKNSPKTKYPYRDGIPNEKSASYVANAWLAAHSHVLHLRPSSRVALRMEGIEEGLNPKYIERAAGCSVGVNRVDRKNLRWIFSVDCGNGPKVVKLKATRKGNVTRLSKMDLDFQCSCPAWRWQGCEHWSQGEDYLLGDPRGTASFPVVRDPSGINRVCKHVAAVIAKTRRWVVAKK